ncbi:MAG: acetoacetate--CoA ligase [Chitinophagaceae bacterium]|nr:acetoacetate--CoA ligase [Chitinophagaceae bacterium]MCW5926808.1 acetoacetate--CoA ligase [Chitinophagaceae bacterium]
MTSKLVWLPDKQATESSDLHKYMQYVNKTYHRNITTYDELWQWSVEQYETFWTSLFHFFDLTFEGELSPVTNGDTMPDIEWFPGARLNFSENLVRHARGDEIAITELNEAGDIRYFTWNDVLETAAKIQAFLLLHGLKPGDRVCGLLTNTFETSAALLAVTAGGFIWSCCSPDFGVESVLDRFQQIAPKVFLMNEAYTYGGKRFDLAEKNRMIIGALPSLVAGLNLRGGSVTGVNIPVADMNGLDAVQQSLSFTRLGFSAPLWILYSSGTTGKPKAITHSHGGILLEMQKYHAFHNDLREGELFFWYSTTGWMMWNFLQGAWLQKARILLYEGNPAYPEVDRLWQMASRLKVSYFGTSAPYILANMKAGKRPADQYDLEPLRGIGATGSPLPPEAFDYIFEAVKPGIWLASMSGGTDVCTAFVGGCVLAPVYQGEIQRRTLGCALYCFDESGNSLHDKEGEMVITRPMPSMPVFFWNDPGKTRYRESYFEMYPGIWRHGDWIRLTVHNGIVIYGRSDATLNRQGIRIGTSEIYRSVDRIGEIRDSLIVNLESPDGTHYMPLFVVLKEGAVLDEALTGRIKQQLRTDCSPRHIPDAIIEAPDIPYTLSGKKMEAPVKKILLKKDIDMTGTRDTMRNPDSLDFFVAFRHSAGS